MDRKENSAARDLLAQSTVVSNVKVSFSAQAIEDSCQLNGNVTSSNNSDFFWETFELKKIVCSMAIIDSHIVHD